MKLNENEFDIIVLGAGAGGLNIAGFMNRAGFRVLLIEKSDERIGGDCLNFGCIPSKALIHAAREIAAGRNAARFGVSMTGDADIKKVTEYIKEKQNAIRVRENAEYLKKQGIAVVLGHGRFSGRNEIEVAGARYIGKKIVLAAGSRPRKLDIPGIERARTFTSETIFDIDFFPRRMAVVGAGPVGLEIGQAFQRLGSVVVIIDPANAALPKEDPEIAGMVQKQMEKEGVQFFLGYTPREVEGGAVLVLESSKGTGEEKKMAFDALFAAIGRELNLEGLDLEKAGIAAKDGKIAVNEYLQTANPNVYVCGDIAGGLQFTHASELHAAVILKNFFSPWKKKLSYDHFGWVTYTSPEVATFGLSEKTLRERKIDYRALASDFREDDRAIVDDAADGKMKLFVERDGTILGGAMVAENAGELVQELMLAQTYGMKADKVFNRVYPYPVAARITKRLIGKYLSEKLTPRVKKILRFLYH